LSTFVLRAATAARRSFWDMDRVAAEALELLPESYARALTLRENGRGPAEIAAELDIVVEAVGPLLRIAEAKLARLLAERARAGPETGRTDG
jgi:DNA-directed RNA polymerase specialized sigma24 family protein